MDHYEMLGLKKGATRKAIKKAYKAMAAKSHPDKKTGNADTHQALTVAYNVLIDPKKRDHYDKTGEDTQAAPQARWEVLMVSLFDILIAENFAGNIINEARGRLVGASMAQQALLSQNEQNLRALQKKVGRVTVSHGVNFYAGLIQQKIEITRANIEKAIEEKDAITEALDQIDTYTDTKPSKPNGPAASPTGRSSYVYHTGRGPG